MIDTLHTVDQGVASHIIGNVFWLLAVKRRAFGGRTQEQQVKALDKHMVQWYKDTKAESRVQGKLTIERVRTSGKWPKLKAKVAATRHLAAYALHLVETFGTDADGQVRALCQLLLRFYQLLASESQFLSEGAKAELPVLGSNLAIIYSALSAQAIERNERMWKMMPKLHMFDHLCQWQAIEVGNPRFFWTYTDEDLVGLLVECARSCHIKTVAASALFKWLHVYYQ